MRVHAVRRSRDLSCSLQRLSLGRPNARCKEAASDARKRRRRRCRLQIDVLQPSQLEAAAGEGVPVEGKHFRLVFSHTVLDMPTARIVADDDIEITTVPPGGSTQLDHPLLPPHQAGQLLKVSFLMEGVTASTHYRIDLSTLFAYVDGVRGLFPVCATLIGCVRKIQVTQAGPSPPRTCLASSGLI